MGRKKTPNAGTVPCLVCGQRFEYLTSGHLASATCASGPPNDIDAYRTWVAEKHDIDTDDPIFETNQIQKPQFYRKHAERLELPQ